MVIVTPSVSKRFVFKMFLVRVKMQNWRYEIPPAWHRFRNTPFLWRISVDGRPNRKNKPAFPNFSGEGRMGHLQQNYFLINNAAKCKIQKPSTCRATLFRCNFWVDRFRFFNLSRKVAQQKKLLQVGEMQRADWMICLVWIQDKLGAWWKTSNKVRICCSK